MQSSHRVLERAVVLEYTVQRANELDQRLLVVFSLTDGYPDPTSTTTPVCSSASKDVEEKLRRRVIKFVVREGSPDEVALEAGEMASLTVTDRGYMRSQER
jgi:deoxyribodipyrimidine photo-lyase